MARKNSVPNYSELITVTYAALKALGGSGKNDEINNKAAEILGLSDDVLEVPHLNSSSLSEINYRLAWARTLLKRSGAITNSARAVWAISPSFSDVAEVDGAAINKAYHKLNAPKKDIPADADPEDMPEEVRPWRKKLYEVLIHMDPYAFERLTQRVLRECGFTQVEVTKKSGDGGIDGTGKLRINGIFSFNIAFQCKRYQGKEEMLSDVREAMLYQLGVDVSCEELNHFFTGKGKAALSGCAEWQQCFAVEKMLEFYYVHARDETLAKQIETMTMLASRGNEHHG